jgi:hypothetical protein
MSALAKTYVSESRDREAEPLLTNLLEGRRRVLGKEHPDTLDTLVSLGEVRLRQRHFRNAEGIFREALASYEKVMSDSWQRYWCQSLLGASLARQERTKQAEPLLVSGYEGLLKRQANMEAAEVSRLTKARDLIVQLYRDNGSPEKAAAWSEKMARERKVQGHDP